MPSLHTPTRFTPPPASHPHTLHAGKKAPKRSYEERVALQKDKDKEKKQKRDEKNLERLRR